MLETHTQKLGFLFFSLCRLRATKADKLMEQFGLYRGQAVLLLILSHHDGITHSEIAEKLEISPAAATKVIHRMEKLCYVQRRPDPTDARVWRVYLQDPGRALVDEIHASFAQLDRMTFQGFSDNELQTLSNLLSQMQSNLQSIEPVCE